MLTIYLARHGQDEDNEAGILNGRRDKPLTELGKHQAQELAEKIRVSNIGFDAIYSSPLQRAFMTAEYVAPEGVTIETLDDLAERDFGVMTGVPVSEIASYCEPDVVKTPNVTYFLSPEGAETFPDLMERAKRVLSFLKERHKDSTKDTFILLVTHGDLGKMFYAAYYNLDWMDVLKAFHFGNSDLILCSPNIISFPPDTAKTHVFSSSSVKTTSSSIISNPTPLGLWELLEGPPAPFNVDGTSITAKLLVDCRCHLGECVLYDEQQNAVLFTNILDRKFHKLSLEKNNGTKHLESFDLPKMLCSFGLLNNKTVPNNKKEETNHPGYLAAWEDGFQLYDLEGSKPLGLMSEGEVVNRSGLPDRLNDGRVDPTGTRFVCGGCAGSPDNTPLKVYSCTYDRDLKLLKHSPILNEIRTTNSICFSNDGATMYLSDSPTKQIDQYDYNVVTGEICNKRLLHTKRFGDPDGSIVDAQGFVWNATWRHGKGTGMVERIDPNTGSVVFTVHLPDETSEVSSCCFGGSNLDILFITTAWESLDPASEPHAGGLYAVKLPSGISGCLEKRFII